MKIGTWVAIYFVVWWVTLFTILPFGVRSQQETGEVVPGSEPGAPARPRLLRVMLINTAVAAVVFLGVMWLVENAWS